jgi:hypothetical protein
VFVSTFRALERILSENGNNGNNHNNQPEAESASISTQKKESSSNIANSSLQQTLYSLVTGKYRRGIAGALAGLACLITDPTLQSSIFTSWLFVRAVRVSVPEGLHIPGIATICLCLSSAVILA